MEVTPADIRSLVFTHADRVDKALVEAQAQAMEGNLERAASIRETARTWITLIKAIADPAVEDDGEFD